jgi:hypothetical protein
MILVGHGQFRRMVSGVSWLNYREPMPQGRDLSVKKTVRQRPWQGIMVPFLAYGWHENPAGRYDHQECYSMDYGG